MKSLKGRNVLITEADKGLGHKMAISFAAEGMNTGLLGCSEHHLKKIAKDVKLHGVKTSVVTADVSDINEAFNAVNQVKTELGFIDTLINNFRAASANSSEDAILGWPNPNIGVVTKGMGYVIRAALPEMIRNKKGDIINITPAACLKKVSPQHVYATTRDEVIRMSESLMKEVRKYNVRVTSLTPNLLPSDYAVELGVTNGNEEYDREVWFEDVTEEVLSQLKMYRYPTLTDATLIPVIQY